MGQSGSSPVAVTPRFRVEGDLGMILPVRAPRAQGRGDSGRGHPRAAPAPCVLPTVFRRGQGVTHSWAQNRLCRELRLGGGWLPWHRPFPASGGKVKAGSESALPKDAAWSSLRLSSCPGTAQVSVTCAREKTPMFASSFTPGFPNGPSSEVRKPGTGFCRQRPWTWAHKGTGQRLFGPQRYQTKASQAPPPAPGSGVKEARHSAAGV